MGASLQAPSSGKRRCVKRGAEGEPAGGSSVVGSSQTAAGASAGSAETLTPDSPPSDQPGTGSLATPLERALSSDSPESGGKKSASAPLTAVAKRAATRTETAAEVASLTAEARAAWCQKRLAGVQGALKRAAAQHKSATEQAHPGETRRTVKGSKSRLVDLSADELRYLLHPRSLSQ